MRIDKGSIGRYRFDHNGFLLAPGVLTRVGVFTYRHMDGSIVHEARYPQDVFEEEAVKSFINLPITLGHPPPGRVTPQNVKQYAVGNTGDSIDISNGTMKAVLVVRDEDAINSILPGDIGRQTPVRELSCGYHADVVKEDGVFNLPGHPDHGTRYSHRQTNIRGNHLALVEKGRAGPSVRILLDAEDAIQEPFAEDPHVLDLKDGFSRETKEWIQRKIKELIGKGKTPDQAAGQAYAMARAGNMKCDDDPPSVQSGPSRCIGKTTSGKDIFCGLHGQDFSDWTFQDHQEAAWRVGDEHQRVRNALDTVQRLGLSDGLQERLRQELSILRAAHDYHKTESMALDHLPRSVSRVVMLRK